MQLACIFPNKVAAVATVARSPTISNAYEISKVAQEHYLWRLYKSHKLHDYNNLIKFVATVATSNQKEQGDANKMIQEMKGATRAGLPAGLKRQWDIALLGSRGPFPGLRLTAGHSDCWIFVDVAHQSRAPPLDLSI